jgi:molybdopterin/thiamine biosynthesis adenylyltransferase
MMMKVEDATALVLGCGGLGNGVAMGLCRLGVRKLILVDMDEVEATNLNRQILFTKDVVGMRKVEVQRCLLNVTSVASDQRPIALCDDDAGDDDDRACVQWGC